MKKIYDPANIEAALSSCHLADILRSTNAPLFLIEYEQGEIVSNHGYFQIVVRGILSISFVRDDGSAYSLSSGDENYIIGEIEFLRKEEHSVIAEATSPLLTIAIDTAAYGEILRNSVSFLRLVAETMAAKIISITNDDAVPSSLSERVLNYVKYKCEDQILHGIEKTAYRLHCSPRQLQRILNQMEKDALVVKIGKGQYRFLLK